MTQKTAKTSRRTYWLMAITTVIGLLHHTDHVLRADHSGWPFTSNFNEFTISVIVAYSIAAFVFLKRGALWTKFALLVVAFIATQAAHIFIEMPTDQYAVWAFNASIAPESLGEPNLLNVESPLLGGIAVIISLALSVSLMASALSAYFDLRHAQITASKRHSRRHNSSPSQPNSAEPGRQPSG